MIRKITVKGAFTMFREMAKKNKQISSAQCIDLLKQVPRGVLSLQGDDGYPYGVPTNFWYNDADGCIYFHGGKTGHKVDAMVRSSKASLCVMSEGVREKDDWALSFHSVIVFGTVEILTDHAQILDAVRLLSRQFTQDETFIEGEIAQYAHETLCFRLVPEHITGKRIQEA